MLVGADLTVDGLTGPEAAQLDTAICRAIVRNLDIGEADLVPVKRFAAWAGRANYHLPLEVFTVNYDLLLETAFEELAVPYFDGFVGTLRARFRTDLVEATPTAPAGWVPSLFLRLWKIHGSVNWLWSENERSEILRLGAPVRSLASRRSFRARWIGWRSRPTLGRSSWVSSTGGATSWSWCCSLSAG